MAIFIKKKERKNLTLIVIPRKNLKWKIKNKNERKKNDDNFAV